jgi:hypothetical protein
MLELVTSVADSFTSYAEDEGGEEVRLELGRGRA